MKFGNYQVVKEKEKLFAIYNLMYTPKKLLTHKGSWHQATTIAKHLEDAYNDGFAAARDIYYDDAWRD